MARWATRGMESGVREWAFVDVGAAAQASPYVVGAPPSDRIVDPPRHGAVEEPPSLGGGPDPGQLTTASPQPAYRFGDIPVHASGRHHPRRRKAVTLQPGSEESALATEEDAEEGGIEVGGQVNLLPTVTAVPDGVLQRQFANPSTCDTPTGMRKVASAPARPSS